MLAIFVKFKYWLISDNLDFKSRDRFRFCGARVQQFGHYFNKGNRKVSMQNEVYQLIYNRLKKII